MRRLCVKIIGNVCLICFLVMLGMGIGNAVTEVKDKLVARVNGVPLTERQVSGVLSELSGGVFHVAITPEKKEALHAEALEELIKRELYFQEAKELGMTVDRAALQSALSKMKARYNSEKEFAAALRASGHTPESLAHEIEKNMLVARFFEKEVVEKSAVTDEMLRGYYEANKKDYMRDETVKIRHILIKVDPSLNREEREEQKKRAGDILAKAKAGEDFAGLASQYSMDEWKFRGGDLGAVHRGRLEPELEDAVFRLEVGQISGLIETRFGYHIVQVYEKIPPTQLSFDEVSGKMRKQFMEKRRRMAEETLLKRLKDKANIERF